MLMESFHQMESGEMSHNESTVERLREELKRAQHEKQQSAEAGMMLCGENDQLCEQMQKQREKACKEIEVRHITIVVSSSTQKCPSLQTLLEENSTMKKRYEDMRKARERTEEENINLYEELRTTRERATAELKAKHEGEMRTMRQKVRALWLISPEKNLGCS